MLNINVPDSLGEHHQIGENDILFVHYRESSPAGRNLISFNRCAISFILSGEKELYRQAESMIVRQNESVIIPHGNAIIAERKLNAVCYSSLVIFFPINIAQEFVRKIKLNPNTGNFNQSAETGLFKFRVTTQLSVYIKHLLEIINQQIPLSYPIITHKLEELFLILSESNPAELLHMFGPDMPREELYLRTIVESNLSKGLTLTELAFLANRSLASFKRDFEKAYGTSPGKYMQQRKLEIATHVLQSGKTATEAAFETGYDNLSNFTTAFKKHYGKTPKNYQLSSK